jgi:hypothetical protein
MSEPDPTGYGDSPDTIDGSAPRPTEAAEADAGLTTDDDAQTDDGIVRPGNEAD